MLNVKNPTKVTSPELNATKLTLLEELGIKNPTIVEANKIFAKSANSLETDSIWSWFKRIPANYINNSSGVNASFVDNDDDRKDITWNKISKIELLPAEEVFDITVEGTHNFIGNGIIAHNTYVGGNLTTAGSFSLNSEAFTDLTGAGLTNSGGVLSLDTTSS